MLVPQSGFRAEGNAAVVKGIRNFLEGKPIYVQRRNVPCGNGFLLLNCNLSLYDLIAIQNLTVGHVSASESRSVN